MYHLLLCVVQKALQTYLYEHLLTSRRHTDEKGRIYLDLKHGDLRTHEITTLETDHVSVVVYMGVCLGLCDLRGYEITSQVTDHVGVCGWVFVWLGVCDLRGWFIFCVSSKGSVINSGDWPFLIILTSNFFLLKKYSENRKVIVTKYLSKTHTVHYSKGQK